MSTDVLLQKLKEYQPTLIPIYIPSIKKTVNFKPLNIKQQKEVIKSSFDKNIPGITFGLVLNNIISENSTESIDYLVIDRPAISLQLRKNIYGNDIIATSDDEDINTEEKINLTVDEIFNNITTVNVPELTAKVNVDIIEVGLSIPTLSVDSRANKEAQKNLSYLIEQNNGVKDLVSELFLYELVKFVDYINIGDSKAIFKDLLVNQQIQIIESLPASVNKQILDFIENTRSFERKYTTITKNNRNYNLTIDASFFSNE